MNDEGDDIIIDLSQYKDNSVIFQLTLVQLSGSETNSVKLQFDYDLNVELSVVDFSRYYMKNDPIFVPAPSAVEEDDSIITSVVLDSTKNTDAKSFKEIARAEMDHGKVVPYRFHGLWNQL
ncbi:8650_t:CDS:2 [Scutellospora calospora]|uniref:8650_t:CDS:1 n=1 Tax=Scutellospora calospora TaxID=85575 RepID=A0ACA9K7X8_9GLOM|nr:8650_t:CDS:2 [Scutellospora calospora]